MMNGDNRDSARPEGPELSEQQAAAYSAAIEAISQVQGVLTRLSDEHEQAGGRDQAAAERLARHREYWVDVRSRLQPEDSAAVAETRQACADFLEESRRPGR